MSWTHVQSPLNDERAFRVGMVWDCLTWLKAQINNVQNRNANVTTATDQRPADPQEKENKDTVESVNACWSDLKYARKMRLWQIRKSGALSKCTG
jgi:hypothetical protein